MASRLLDDGVGPGWRRGGDAALWELHDAGAGEDDEPVAVAATRVLSDGRRVRLAGLAVAPPHCDARIGQRMIEDLSDALRARGVLVMVAAVPCDEPAALDLVQRGGLRPSHVERASAECEGRDLVWFDVEL